MSATFGLGAASAEAYTLRLNSAEASTSVVTVAALRFAAAVERRSKGQVKIEVYPSYQLAAQGATVDALTNGVIDLALIVSSLLVPLVPRYQIFDMPFLFKDAASAYRVLDGPTGKELLDELELKGVVGLGWASSGFRQIETATKQITVPEDMRGLRIRIQANPVYAATYQALGAIPVTIDVSEVYTAVTQHAVDAVDFSLDAFVANKSYVVAPHVALANQILSLSMLMGSKRKIDVLPAPLQRIVFEEARSVVPFWRALTLQQTANNVRFLKQHGVTFTEIQYPAFRKAVDPVYATVQQKLGANFVDKVSRAR